MPQNAHGAFADDTESKPLIPAGGVPVGDAQQGFGTAAWIRALKATAGIAKAPARTFPVVMDELAARFADAPAFLAASGELTYRQAAGLANRYARWALAQGFGKGDCVALLMANSAEYMPIWIGLSGVGCIVALLNTNLEGAALAHCIDAAAPKAIVASSSYAAAAEGARPFLKASSPVLWTEGGGKRGGRDLGTALNGLSDGVLNASQRQGVTLSDPALYIYTSGTTGLPKAARVSHHRIMAWTHWFMGLLAIDPQDRLYNCLPMYHSIGGVAAPGALLAAGGSVVVREKFSARRFWQDVAETRCSIFQYIGELCRYLVGSPATEAETRHSLRLACGNGLSEPVWREFQRRFNIPQIVEFYAATEGTFSLYNVEGVPGSIGRVPSFMPHSSQIKIVRCDPASGRVLRGADGLCIPCGPGEAGEAIGHISAEARFEGYTAEADTERKVLRGAFRAGDAWFRTGDLMVKDKKGFFYFVDRLGDTFRWKGENVSTSEVRDCLSGFEGVLDVTVYGVPVPGAEGRAGMAAIVPGSNFEVEKLSAYLDARLPSYARPLFVRLSEKIDVTSTFKHRKADLAREGFDPGRVADRLYLRDPKTQGYVVLDRGLYSAIAKGAIRL